MHEIQHMGISWEQLYLLWYFTSKPFCAGFTFHNWWSFICSQWWRTLVPNLLKVFTQQCTESSSTTVELSSNCPLFWGSCTPGQIKVVTIRTSIERNLNGSLSLEVHRAKISHSPLLSEGNTNSTATGTRGKQFCGSSEENV